ncbi:MAG: endonuclease III [Anaerolineales bacterium]
MTEIEALLMGKGTALFQAPLELVQFTGNIEADELLNDLENSPHAFVLACIMDRQIKAELAWLIPYELRKRIGTLEFQALAKLSDEEIRHYMTTPDSLHRFPNDMSTFLHKAINRIQSEYFGNAASIWGGSPSSSEVVYRFLQFDGVGPKIAAMSANILARELKVPFSDYYSIDISPDVHVHRVFRRLGLIEPDSSNEQLVYRARSISPEFPGLLDYPAWQIGREWCRPRAPNCEDCYMKMNCPTAQQRLGDRRMAGAGGNH